jgi:ElaB/YqjD/DUF883 family membrane-anchored ribosome-binding protein
MAKARKGFYWMNDQKSNIRIQVDVANPKKNTGRHGSSNVLRAARPDARELRMWRFTQNDGLESTLEGDGVVQFSKFENNVSQAADKAREEISTWVEEGVLQLNQGLEKLTGDARETMVNTAATMKKDVRQGLNQFNAKAQNVADQIPGDFSQRVARYPWVVLSIALVVGFLLGILFKTTRQQ